jgi:eukaryotic-like serine/threonine-protein kinase
MSGDPENPARLPLGSALPDPALEPQTPRPHTGLIADDLKAAAVAAHRSGAAASEASAPTQLIDAPAPHWRHLLLFERIGAGAFGAVYRGFDPLVNREVAVKLLPKEARGRSSLEEGRALARIRHPNVVVVYGADQEADQVGIWMEYLAGQTLADIVRDRGPMSAWEVSGIGIDLCHALSALHASGLLHRDIKAENVMREAGGRIVLMDFSSAEHVVPEAGITFSGTPGYMAPELFAGAPATFASDVYSLGVLLFFLLSGRFPVAGTTIADIKNAHAGRQHALLRDARPDVADRIVQVVERAIAYAPADRYQTTGEMERALASASGADAFLTPPPDSSPLAARARRSWPLDGRWTALVIAALILTAAVMAGRTAMFSTPPSQAARVVFSLGPPLMSGSWPRLSPDGRMVVYGARVNGREQLWIRSLDSLAGRVLEHTTATATPFWSPDGRSLGFFADGKLFTIDVDGGDPLVLVDAPHPRGGDWSAAGTILFSRTGGIHRVVENGSHSVQVTALDESRGEFEHGWPEFLPDGRRFLYIVRSSRLDQDGLYVGSLDSPERRRVMPAYSRVAYQDGHLLFIRDGTLQAQPFDVRTAALRGEPVALAHGVNHHQSSDAAFDVAGDALIYAPVRGQPQSELALFDRHGARLKTLTPVGAYRQPRFSPDGQRIVVERIDTAEGSSDLWIFDIGRDSASRLTRSEAPDVKPVWSPDGTQVAFSSKRETTYQIFSKPVDSTEEARPLVTRDGNLFVESWSADGRFLSATLLRQGLWVFPADSREQPWAVRTGDAATWQSAFSPDGRWIAYASSESGHPEIYVEPLPPTGSRWQVSTNGGAEPYWRGDGEELFYLSARGELMGVSVGAGRWQTAKPQPMFALSVPNYGRSADYSVSPDGRLVVANLFVADPVLPPVNVVLNWTTRLRR